MSDLGSLLPKVPEEEREVWEVVEKLLIELFNKLNALTDRVTALE